MTVTRSQTGATPRRSAMPEGFVETPTRRTRSTRRSGTTESAEPEEHTGAANGSNGASKAAASKTPRSSKAQSHKIDTSGEFEFGGTPGVTAIMIFFPIIMYYMWIGATYYDGKLPVPAKGESMLDFGKHLLHLIATGAFPSLKAWAIYWVFFVVQCVLYIYMPGVYTKGKPLEHLGGKQLEYYCSGVTSFYSTIVVMIGLHYFGIFHLWTLMDEFGPIMSVAIISGIAVSVIAYISAIVRGAEHRMTGYLIYDFFMGAELNPRMFKWLDFKMFFEVRLPWFILFFITLGGCARQYEQYGYVSGEMAFVLMAHWLYANACCKGEEMIPITWDMYYEKWGFMLIFWNMAGVPLSYCHCSIYLANHAPEEYRWPRWFLAFLYFSYLFMYWVWDSCASQKNGFRAQQRGTDQVRATFPQLPWRRVKNPRTIPVPGKDPLFADGWYRYARKIHYTSDMWFAICWGLVCGFNSPFPWFYAAFFAPMIAHRASRDLARCRERYGAAWEQYEKECPYLFIPGIY